MKILRNNGLTQKIIIAILIMISFNFVAPTYSRADVGGMILGPLIDLTAGLFDSIMALLQAFMDGGDNIEFKSTGFLQDAEGFDVVKYEMEPLTGTEADENKIEIDAAVQLSKGLWGLTGYRIPIIKYSPEKIFYNDVPALDSNFINPTDWGDSSRNDKSIARQLQTVISEWYNALRNLVIVLLLSILLYVGIRMMLTSISTDKAKYKQMLMDWIVALCLLFFLHYIMLFTMTFVQIITDGIGNSTEFNIELREGTNTITTYKSNLTGYCRLLVTSNDLYEKLVYLIFYIGLVIMTAMFTWKYMKRAIMLAFLTLMAPLVTLTYPLDKMGDGKAQAFNMWLKEYIFNALLQPLHLILYSIFLGSSIQLVTNNPLYAILFLLFMTKAEGIVKKFFGFDKAPTTGATSFAGGFGGAAAYNALKSLMSKGAKAMSHAKNGDNNSGGNVRYHQNQVNDPNAPDGSATPFLVSARSGGTGGNSGSNVNNAQNNNSNSNNTALPAGQNNTTSNSTLTNVELQDGNIDPALAGAAAAANANESYNSTVTPEEDKPFTLSDEGERIRRQQQLIDDLKQDTQDENKEYLDEEARRLREQVSTAQTNKLNENKTPPVNQQERPTNLTRKIEKDKKTVRQMADNVANKDKGSTNEKTVKPRSRPLRGIGRVAGHVGKGALKLTGKALAAGAVGAIGLGMAVAGDDPDDLFKYGIGGAALGWTAGPAVARNIASGVSSVGSGIRNAYEEGAYGNTEAALMQHDREYVRNQDNRDFFEAEMTKENGTRPSRGELNQTMRVAAEYDRAGVTDLKQINKSMLLEKELQQQLQQSTSMSEGEATQHARAQAITIAKMAEGISAKDLRDKGKAQQLQDSFARELKSKDSSITDQAAQAQASRILELVKRQKKIY